MSDCGTTLDPNVTITFTGTFQVSKGGCEEFRQIKLGKFGERDQPIPHPTLLDSRGIAISCSRAGDCQSGVVSFQTGLLGLMRLERKHPGDLWTLVKLVLSLSIATRMHCVRLTAVTANTRSSHQAAL